MNIYPNVYYNYRKHRKGAGEKKKAFGLKMIEKTYHECGGRTGHRMMQKMILNKEICLSAQTIHKYMNTELELRSVSRKAKYRYRKGTEAYAIFDDLLGRDFKVKGRDEKWCIDFTYLFLANRSKRYNCTIIDLYDQRVVASVNREWINAKLAIDTVRKAFERSGKKGGMILHSDRGSQFTSKEFVEFCEANGITQSMSRAGRPYDNSPMERYFNTLKAELINLRSLADEEMLYE